MTPRPWDHQRETPPGRSRGRLRVGRIEAQVGGGILPGFNTVTPTTVNILSVSFTHMFSPRMLMEVRGGYNRFEEQFFPQDKSFDPSSLETRLQPGG